MSDQMPDMGALFQQAQAIQQQLMEAQAKAAAQIVEGKSAGGAVTIRATGGGVFESVHIDPTLLQDDAGMLEDLVLAALHDTTAKIKALNEEATGGLGSMLGM
jgi:nucleoid-associated protein EbfC